ncbi:TapY2 family type IVa secretion system protein [Colwellia ponticola]|uniref:DUF3718 domain-containing protein n=1 Tax=Colwellia ponticola TaxID=2304625 RepID=A0A8H2JNY9_9GAMM|nr:TapY2 family type IVa secretion system protein [Colwellia ponticola]TMM45923.1 hypothetical protein FCS21_06250 [Colwellia ponticola]
MKTIIIVVACFFTFTFFASQAAIPNTTTDKNLAKAANKVNAKCHVALINGHEAIVFYRLNVKKFSRLTDNIVGKKVLTQESNKKIKIYRVYECVLETDNFTEQKSRLLDAKTLR